MLEKNCLQRCIDKKKVCRERFFIPPSLQKNNGLSLIISFNKISTRTRKYLETSPVTLTSQRYVMLLSNFSDTNRRLSQFLEMVQTPLRVCCVFFVTVPELVVFDVCQSILILSQSIPVFVLIFGYSAVTVSFSSTSAELHRNIFVSVKLRTNQRATMAFIEENWQTKRSTIEERTSFIFNTEILSDVKFVVPVSTGESESKKVIPAHKFVLAISSPVFFAMFYGHMAETTDSIELPDCEYESLLELFRYLYTDEVKLSGSNVMQVLYLANKYMVPSLAGKCNKYLRHNLKTSNVFCILPLAQKFEDKELEDRCWEVIEKQTEEAVTSVEFVTVERSLVETVVKREKLNVKEVELFKAVDRWATKEGERQGITPDGDAKRRILGEEIVKAIRFPLMSQKEFASVVIDSGILTLKEVGDMVKLFNDVSASPLPFVQAPRLVALAFNRFQRFETFYPSDRSGRWTYGSLPEGINFSVNKPIKLHGVQHFGSESGRYTVSIEVADITDNLSLVTQSGTYTSVKDETYGYYGFDVLFDRPVCLTENKEYKLVSKINGPDSWYGKDGQSSVESQGVRFTFRRSSDKRSCRTYDTSGQFPAFLVS